LRNTLLKNISQKLQTEEDIIVLLGDLGTFQMREASKIFPDRVINFGIMEQSMIGFASGLAKGGFYPNLGPTHHCPHDVSNLLSINHPYIVHPLTKLESIKICDYLISHKQQAYFRLSTSECELDNSKFKKVEELNLEKTSEKQTFFEKYQSISKNKSKNKILSVLFGPDSIFLGNYEQIINCSGTLITVPIITQKSLKDLALEIKNYDEIFLFIPYEPSSLISKLLTYLSYKNVLKPSFIKAIHPKNIFFDNSFKKESILKCFSQETQIM